MYWQKIILLEVQEVLFYKNTRDAHSTRVGRKI